jgi:uncharacterized protein (DUF2267 family)
MNNYNDRYSNNEGNRSYGIDHERWQNENIGLRAGKGSTYDTYNIKGDGQGWHASERFGERAMRDSGSGHVYNTEQREFALREGYNAVHHNHDRSGQKKRIRSMNFEEYAAEGNRFINEVARELDCDRDTAARVTRAVLHAVRDRIPGNDAVQFAQGLPMALKGVYFDRYDISRTPVIIRSAGEFISFVRDKDRFAAIVDFPYPQNVVKGIRAVFRVLQRNMDHGQVQQIINIMPLEVQEMIDAQPTRARM